MKSKGNVRVFIDANTDGILKGTARAERDFRRSDAQATGLASLRGAAGMAGAALGFGALVEGKRSVEAAMQAEAAQARLQAQLGAMGISYRAHASEIDTVIQKHSRLAALDDEDLQDAFVNIVRSTGNVSQSLRLVAVAADIARAKNMDVAKAGEIVGKVAGGNTGILSRYGIVLKENATKEEALAALQRKFAGQAEAYGKTAAAGQDRFAVAVENIREALGLRLLPWLTRATERASRFAEQMEQGTGSGGRFVRRMDQVIGIAGRIAGWLGDHKALVAGAVAGWGVYRTAAVVEMAKGTVAANVVGRALDAAVGGKHAGKAWGERVRASLWRGMVQLMTVLKQGGSAARAAAAARSIAAGLRVVPGPVSLAVMSYSLTEWYSRLFPEARYGKGVFRGTGGPRDYSPAIEAGQDIADFLGIGSPAPGVGRVTAPLSAPPATDAAQVSSAVVRFGPRMDEVAAPLGITGSELLGALVVHTGAVLAPAEPLEAALDTFTRQATAAPSATVEGQQDAALAAAEATATKADDLEVKERQRRAARTRIERTKRALARGGLRGSTEQRLTQELASKRREHKSLTDEIRDLRGRGDEANNSQRLTDIYDVMLAKAEGTETLDDDRRAQEGQLALTTGRVDEIRKALRNPKLREETRSRLQQELAQRIREQQALKSAIKPTFTRQDYDDAFAAQASLTPDLQDDLIAASRRQSTAVAGYNAAVASGDPRGIAEAAQALKSASDELKAASEAIKQAAYTGFEEAGKAWSAELTKAQVFTPDDKADDQAVLSQALANATAAFNQAVASGDTDQTIRWGGEVQAIRGAIEQLGTAVTHWHGVQAEITRMRREQAERLHRESQEQYGDLGDAFVKYLEGTFGAA